MQKVHYLQSYIMLKDNSIKAYESNLKVSYQ